MELTHKKLSAGPDTYLSELASHADALFHGPKYEQFAAICYRRDKEAGTAEVLLVTSRQSGRWVIPKGWPMKGKKPHEVAETEAFEEAGVRGKAKKKPFGYFTYIKQLVDGGHIPCLVQVHLLDVEKIAATFPEKDERVSEWVSLDEAARRVSEPELKGVFLALEKKFSKKRRDK